MRDGYGINRSRCWIHRNGIRGGAGAPGIRRAARSGQGNRSAGAGDAVAVGGSGSFRNNNSRNRIRAVEFIGADVGRRSVAGLSVVIDRYARYGHTASFEAAVAGGREVQVGGRNEVGLYVERHAILAGSRLPCGKGGAVGSQESQNTLSACNPITVVVDGSKGSIGSGSVNGVGFGCAGCCCLCIQKDIVLNVQAGYGTGVYHKGSRNGRRFGSSNRITVAGHVHRIVVEIVTCTAVDVEAVTSKAVTTRAVIDDVPKDVVGERQIGIGRGSNAKTSSPVGAVVGNIVDVVAAKQGVGYTRADYNGIKTARLNDVEDFVAFNQGAVGLHKVDAVEF